MKLSVQFIYLFTEFLKRFSYNKKILTLLNYNDVLIHLNSKLTIHYFSIFFFKNIHIRKSIFVFLIIINYYNFIVKDYRVFFFLEFLVKFNYFSVKQ
jgi:hypothetical protein